MSKLILIPLLFVTAACTTVKDQQGRHWPALAVIPYDKEKPGAPSSARSGVRVYTGTVNGRAVTVVVPH